MLKKRKPFFQTACHPDNAISIPAKMSVQKGAGCFLGFGKQPARSPAHAMF
ncbi:hypothetical protein HMPREF9098_2041 [Kingella denitrificans ATCC 33394]|uniref:Uncharacterized protein n=1 Tax=Kingella denitrificans ATCC 33394 TaxID=888741 RepID=F0F1Q6_9NEIS|nr:hypothetical protein HMPREF9098_2041 [Kingella denitrificans ATCC 33394]